MKIPSCIYQLKITLLEICRPMWRLVQLSIAQRRVGPIMDEWSGARKILACGRRRTYWLAALQVGVAQVVSLGFGDLTWEVA